MATTSTIKILTADKATTVAANVASVCASALLHAVLLSEEKLTLRFVHETADVALVDPGMVVQLDSRDMEYRVRSKTTGSDGQPVIDTYALWHDLQDRVVRKEYDSGRVDSTFSIVKRTPAAALAEIMASAPAEFAAGNIDAALVTATPDVTLPFTGEDVLTAIAKLAAALNGEWKIRVVNSSGIRTYYVDIVTEISEVGTRIVTDTHEGVSNQLALTKKRHDQEYFSRLLAIVGDEAENVTLADADWKVTAAAAVAAGMQITLSGSPVPFDDCFIDYFFGNPAEGCFRIVDSIAPNKIVLRTGFDGHLRGYFATDINGRRLDFIPILKALEKTFGTVEKVQRYDGTPMINLLRENAISDDMNDVGAEDVPTGWAKVGTPTLEQITDDVITVTGTASLLILASEGQGIETSLVEVTGEYLSSWVAMAVEAGEVVVEMEDEAGNIFPENEQASTNSRALRALTIGGVAGFTGKVKLRIKAVRDETVIKLDAVTLTPSGTPYEWAEVMGPRDLWEAAGILVDEQGGAVFDEISSEAIDLAEIGVAGYSRIEVGSAISIQSGEDPVTGNFKIDIETRVIEMDREMISDDVQCRVKLEAARADLVDLMTRLRNERRREIAEAPRTRREKPTLKVERVADADSELFTLTPLDGRGQPLVNWEIFADVDVGSFVVVATDRLELKVAGVDMYPAGSSYFGKLPAQAAVTVDVTFPTIVDAYKIVRFYVHHKTSGLASDILEFLVSNPNIDASRVDGTIVAGQLEKDAQRFNTNVDFTPLDWDTGQWTTGTIWLADGSSFSLAAGNTGAMAASSDYFIYFDGNSAHPTNPNNLVVTTTFSDAVGSGKILMCFARAASTTTQNAMVIPAIGVAGINRENLSPDAVSTTQITDDAVTTPKLVANAVTAAKISAGAVITEKLDALAITTDKVAANAITSAKIAALAIQASHIEAGAVTLTKLNFTPLVSSGSTTAIIATINASAEGIRIDADNLIISSSAQYADGYDPSDGRAIMRQATAPTVRPSGDPLVAGDKWVDTSTDSIGKVWTGAAWVEDLTRISGAYVKTGTVEAARLDITGTATFSNGQTLAGNINNGSTTIDGGKITALSVTADQIAASAVTASKISVVTLSAIVADLGTVTAGTIVVGSTNKLWLNDGADGALNIGGSTKASAPFRVAATGAVTISGTLTVDNATPGGGGGIEINAKFKYTSPQLSTPYVHTMYFQCTENAFEIVEANAPATRFRVTYDGICEINGNKAWHQGNDGAGSGLDADLLDGYNAGNSSGQIPISNGSLCVNLNADKFHNILYTEVLKINVNIASNTATNMPQYTRTVTLEDAAGGTIKLYGT